MGSRVRRALWLVAVGLVVVGALPLALGASREGFPAEGEVLPAVVLGLGVISVCALMVLEARRGGTPPSRSSSRLAAPPRPLPRFLPGPRTDRWDEDGFWYPDEGVDGPPFWWGPSRW